MPCCGRASRGSSTAEPDFELVGRAADLPELLTLIETESRQVVVTDIRMPPDGHG